MPVHYSIASDFTDPALERALVTAMTAAPDTYFEVADLLLAEAFTDTEAREAYKQLSAAVEAGDRPPALPFEAEPIRDVAAAARRLAELFQRRVLANLAQEFLEKLRSDESAADVVARLEEGLVMVQQAVRELRAGRVVPLPELLPDVLSDVAARRQAVKEKGAAAVGLPTGIRRLDRLLGGLQPGVHLLAAEPGQGKTTFALQVASHVARTGWPALFVSFEESLPRLALKAICAAAGLEVKKFADGYGDTEELRTAAARFGPELRELTLVEGTARLTVAQLRARALQVLTRSKKDRCLIVIDYLQRWAAGRRDFTEFRHVVSALVAELRELALRLNSPVIAISSQNRTGQGRALLTSLKESGDLEYSADTALFLVEDEDRDATPPARAVNLAIEKNRFGDKGVVELIFRPDVGTFREVCTL